jgi:hypothetical protein
MLPDRWTQLLTAYVDGVLSARERRAVERYVQESPEARSLLEQLQRDADRLRRLPRRQLGPEFAGQVLRAIEERAFPPIRPVQVPRVAGLRWNRFVVAAAVLLAVGGGSFLYWASSPEDERGHTAATQRVRPRPTFPQEPDGRKRPAVAAATSPDPASSEPADTAPTPNDGEPGKPAEPTRDDKSRVANAPSPDVGGDALVVAPTPVMELFPELADLRLALVFHMRELEQGTLKKRLHELLHQETTCRIEMSCLVSRLALDRLHAAFLSQGVRLVVDQAALDRLQRRLQTNYVLYTENVTPDELAQVLQRLSQDDRKAEAKRRGDGQFERVVVNRIQPGDHQELSKLFGVDPTKLQPPRPKTPLGVDLRKPLADQTADQVVKSLKGQGTPTERLAIVLPYNPVRPRPASSKEVKLFLDSRKELRAGTVQTILVLRSKHG